MTINGREERKGWEKRRGEVEEMDEKIKEVETKIVYVLPHSEKYV